MSTRHGGIAEWFGFAGRDQGAEETPLVQALSTRSKTFIAVAWAVVCAALFLLFTSMDSRMLGAMLAVSLFINGLAIAGNTTVASPPKPRPTRGVN